MVGLLARLFALFARPLATRWVVAVALLLASPALFSPLVIDDEIQQVMLRPDRHDGGFEDLALLGFGEAGRRGPGWCGRVGLVVRLVAWQPYLSMRCAKERA
jgi:hypothetical protein